MTENEISLEEEALSDEYEELITRKYRKLSYLRRNYPEDFGA